MEMMNWEWSKCAVDWTGQWGSLRKACNHLQSLFSKHSPETLVWWWIDSFWEFHLAFFPSKNVAGLKRCASQSGHCNRQPLHWQSWHVLPQTPVGSSCPLPYQILIAAHLRNFKGKPKRSKGAHQNLTVGCIFSYTTDWHYLWVGSATRPGNFTVWVKKLEMGQAGAVPEQDWTGSFRAAVRLVSFVCNGSFGWLKSFLSSWCPESSHPIQTYPTIWGHHGASIKHHLAYVSRRAFYLQRNNPIGTHHLYTMDYGIWVQYPWHQVSTPTCYVYNLHKYIYIIYIYM